MGSSHPHRPCRRPHRQYPPVRFLQGAPWLYERLVRRRKPFRLHSAGRISAGGCGRQKDWSNPGAPAPVCTSRCRSTGRSSRYWPSSAAARKDPGPSRFIERLTMLGEVIVTAISHKAIAAERLRSETNLAEAQRIANLGSWEWDIAADQVTTSEQCDRIQGLRIGKFDDFMAAIHPHERDMVRRKVEQDMVPPYTKGILEYRICRPDGGVRFVRDVYEFVLGCRRHPGAGDRHDPGHHRADPHAATTAPGAAVRAVHLECLPQMSLRRRRQGHRGRGQRRLAGVCPGQRLGRTDHRQ